MYMYAYFTLFHAFSLLPQLVHGQCFLNAQLHRYENMYNVEIRPNGQNGPYCCCDQGGGTCRSSLSQISTTSCSSPNKFCDTYFVATLSDGQNFETWPTMFTSRVSKDSSTSTNVNYMFSFFLSKVPSESVRLYMRYLICIIVSN